MVSEITPLIIITKLEQYDYRGATAVASVMLVISFILLLIVNGSAGLDGAAYGKGDLMAGVRCNVRYARRYRVKVRSQSGDARFDLGQIRRARAWADILRRVFCFFRCGRICRGLSEGYRYVLQCTCRTRCTFGYQADAAGGGAFRAAQSSLRFGSVMAIAKFQFPGKNLLITFIDLPFSVSPVVAGLDLRSRVWLARLVRALAA